MPLLPLVRHAGPRRPLCLPRDGAGLSAGTLVTGRRQGVAQPRASAPDLSPSHGSGGQRLCPGDCDVTLQGGVSVPRAGDVALSGGVWVPGAGGGAVGDAAPRSASYDLRLAHGGAPEKRFISVTF